MRKFTIIKILLLFLSPLLFAQTTLVVTGGSATLDGVITNGEYTSTPLVTPLGVTIYAMNDGNFFYLAATWSDTTHSIAKKQWFFDGTNWTQSGNEDRLSFVFDMGLNDPDGANCATMCHGDGLMRTNNGLVDVWHWKSHRSNPMGYSDDKYWDTNDRQSDPGTSTATGNGPDPTNGLPEFMAFNDPGANVDFLINPSDIGDFDPFGVLPGTFDQTENFDGGAAFVNGDVIPGYVLRTPDGDRASVMAAGKWDNGVWTVEFKRRNLGSAYDFSVPSGGTVDFTYEIFDNTGGSHPNDGFDATVYTLDFSGITGLEDEGHSPESYVLNQNYPNPFNPSTTISYAVPEESFVSLKVYDVIGVEIQTLVNEKQSAGFYNVSFNAVDLPSGVYFYTLEANNVVKTRKMILLR